MAHDSIFNRHILCRTKQNLSDIITKGTFTGPQNSPAVCFPSHLRDSETVVSRHTGWGQVPKLQPGPPQAHWRHLTWICILARRSRLNVVYRVQSTPRGICCLSCSRHRFSWALLQGKSSGGHCQPHLTGQRDGKGGGRSERNGPWDLVLRARLELTCVSPAHCAQTCQCQEKK